MGTTSIFWIIDFCAHGSKMSIACPRPWSAIWTLHLCTVTCFNDDAMHFRDHRAHIVDTERAFLETQQKFERHHHLDALLPGPWFFVVAVMGIMVDVTARP